MDESLKDKEIIMLPLTEVLAVRWTSERRQKLRELRGDMPLTELARRLKEGGVSVSRQYLDRMETDDRVKGATPELLEGLSLALGVEIAQLLCLKQSKVVQLGVDYCN